MVKAKLFSYSDSNLYYKKIGISPDRHFDKLRERYGTDVATDIVDRNMCKIWEDRQKEREKFGKFERCGSGSECPFTASPT